MKPKDTTIKGPIIMVVIVGSTVAHSSRVEDYRVGIPTSTLLMSQSI